MQCPNLVPYYDSGRDEYSIFVPALGHHVTLSSWRLSQQSYSNIVGKKPFACTLDPIQEDIPQRVPLPDYVSKWSDLAVNDCEEFIPAYVDVQAILAAVYGEKKPDTNTKPKDAANFGWLDFAFTADPALQSNIKDTAKLKAVLSTDTAEKKSEYEPPPTPVVIKKASKKRQEWYYQNKKTYGYVTDKNRPDPYQQSLTSSVPIHTDQLPKVQTYPNPHRRPDLRGYITDDNLTGSKKVNTGYNTDVNANPYSFYDNVEYSDSDNDVLSPSKPPASVQNPQISHKQSHRQGYLTDGAKPTTAYEPFKTASQQPEEKKNDDDGDDMMTGVVFDPADSDKAPVYDEKIYRESRDVSQLYITDEERMEDLVLNTVNPCRYFVNPILIWVEISIEELKKYRSIIPAGKNGRKRLSDRISDRKYRRRSRGATYYTTTVPCGWTLKTNRNPLPVNQWRQIYEQMRNTQSLRLSKLRADEDRRWFQRAMEQINTDTTAAAQTSTTNTAATGTATRGPPPAPSSVQQSINPGGPQQRRDSNNPDLTAISHALDASSQVASSVPPTTTEPNLSGNTEKQNTNLLLYMLYK